MIDDFARGVAAWSAHPSDGVSLDIRPDAGAMRLDFDFHGGAGYAIARRAVSLDLPANYEFAFRVRGEAPPENLEFKLIDSTGDNVWWLDRRDFVFPRDWRTLVTKKRHISFAWGPVGGGEIRHVAAIEIVVTAGSGGAGSVWIDSLTLTPLAPPHPYTLTPTVTASSAADGAPPARALDGTALTSWRSAEDDRAPTLTVDFGERRELGGFTLRWDPRDYATDYALLASRDGARWDTSAVVRGGNGGNDWLATPELDARWLRLAVWRTSRGHGVALEELTPHPVEWSATRNDFLAHVAADAPRGDWPRYLHGEQSYWTIVGRSGGEREALLGEDGALELGQAGPSIEPFLHLVDGERGRLVSWADVASAHSLAPDALPIPSVEWRAEGVTLHATAFPWIVEGSEPIVARYVARNTGRDPVHGWLYLALRPLQVNPPWQFLGTPGGASRIDALSLDRGSGGASAAVVRSGNRQWTVQPLARFAELGATTFDAGAITEHLRRGVLPRATAVVDTSGLASGAFAIPLRLAPGDSMEVYVVTREGAMPASLDLASGPAMLRRAAEEWTRELAGVEVTLPASDSLASRVAETLRAQLAYILVNRDGPAIQPGSRAYSRSWIRDGALTSTALLRLGHAREVHDFIEWFARYQYPDGKVPCCVDRRGADPVPENDSHGEFVYLVAEYWRHTGDATLLRAMWPHVTKAVAYMDSLRHARMTPAYAADSLRAFYGLVPQSISHEGYSAKPMHSYWDDFFTLRGFRDAVVIARALGEDAAARRYAATRDEFERDLLASIHRAMAMHHIDYVPGSVELGDFDATSTTIALEPVGELDALRPELERTFEKYWADFVARRDGARAWENYTPYELRTVGSMVRLGWKERALEALRFFLDDQRPPGWRQWAEVVWRDPRTPKFIGDMPHTWVGSDFIRSALDLLAYEREIDSTLVLAAGVPERWLRATPGISVRGLSTWYGPLGYTMRELGSGAVETRIDGGLRVPPGGIVVRSPRDAPLRGATVNGRAVPFTGGAVVVRELPAVVEMRY